MNFNDSMRELDKLDPMLQLATLKQGLKNLRKRAELLGMVTGKEIDQYIETSVTVLRATRPDETILEKYGIKS